MSPTGRSFWFQERPTSGSIAAATGRYRCPRRDIDCPSVISLGSPAPGSIDAPIGLFNLVLADLARRHHREWSRGTRFRQLAFWFAVQHRPRRPTRTRSESIRTWLRSHRLRSGLTDSSFLRLHGAGTGRGGLPTW